jgi:hypothetical protein
MARALELLFLGVVFLLGAIACAASDIRLESGSTLSVSSTAYSRVLPHAFHDQAIASLPQIFPKHVLLASRRSGVFGEVFYALVCFKETQASEPVIIQAVAVHRDQAWTLDAIAPPSFGDTLMQVLEQIGKLPANPGVQQTPASGRR